MYLTGRFALVSVLVLVASPVIRVSTVESQPAPIMAQTVARLTPFGSVELHDGGNVILRHGPAQSVTLLKGSADYTSIEIVDADKLVIKNCALHCPRGYEMEVEVVTPKIPKISVSDGGLIQSRGSFPRQAAIGVTVSSGGTIDIRSMTVDSVTASVDSGGRIFTTPQTTMLASVVDGGIITYWGDARVKKSIRGGGVVTRGTADELTSRFRNWALNFLQCPPFRLCPRFNHSESQEVACGSSLIKLGRDLINEPLLSNQRDTACK
jgi:hypothetical protein